MKSHALRPFWKCYEELPEQAQALANKNFALFETDPRHPSLGFQNKGGVYTVEVGRRYRAIARERKGEYYWFGSALTRLTTTSSFDSSYVSTTCAPTGSHA